MVKRVVAGILWFYAVASLWNGVALVSGLPAGAGGVPGSLAAVIIWSGLPHIAASLVQQQRARPGRLTGMTAHDRTF